MAVVSFAFKQKRKKALFELRHQLYSKTNGLLYAQLHINRKVNNLVFTLTMRNV